MMIRGLILALLMVAPLSAQASCRDQWASLNDLLIKTRALETSLPGIVREGVNNTCRINGVKIPTRNNVVTIATKSIVWSGQDMERFVAEGLPPTSLSLSVKGISIVPDFRDKTLTYLNELQNRGRTIDLALVADWDKDTKALSLAALNLEFPQDDFIRLSADLEGVDLTTLSTMQMSVGSVSLTNFTADIRSLRMFKDYLLQPIGMAVLSGSDDPEARVAKFKDAAKTIITKVPQSILPSASQSALTALVDDLPDLSGALKLTAVAEPGIGTARFLPLVLRGRSAISPGQEWSLLDGLSVDATYQPF